MFQSPVRLALDWHPHDKKCRISHFTVLEAIPKGAPAPL